MKTVYNQKGQKTGVIKNDTLYKQVSKAKHYMRVLDSWGMDKNTLDEEFSVVKILDKDTNNIYSSSKEDWLTHGFIRNFGHGEQVFLPSKWFKQEK